MIILSTPHIIQEYLTCSKSNQPHLLFLPVVAPISFPVLEIYSPISSNSSVVNGPLPTLVEYPFMTP